MHSPVILITIIFYYYIILKYIYLNLMRALVLDFPSHVTRPSQVSVDTRNSFEQVLEQQERVMAEDGPTGIDGI